MVAETHSFNMDYISRVAEHYFKSAHSNVEAEVH